MDAECNVQIVFKKTKKNFFNQRSKSQTLTIKFRDANQFTTAEDGIGGDFRRQ